MSAVLRLRNAFGSMGPVLFGIGFLAPLIAQSLQAASLPAPLGLTPIQFGLALGSSMGVIARLRGRWI